MTIKTRRDLRYYLDEDLKANGMTYWRFQDRYRRPEVYYQRLMRKLEYLLAQPGIMARAQRSLVRFQFMRTSVATGISIPPGVFGPGLSIAHYGSIVVHSKVRAGAYCRINSATNIGFANGGVPTLGDHVYISPGAVLYGPINVGSRVVIGANAVVGKDISEDLTVGGAPARIISTRNSRSVMPVFVPFPEEHDVA
ncbi:hypothetical protein MRU69_07970 [Kocuria flava]|uniref:serine O-acetyltransferase n=1 Tax=Kocuria flava TaxID=446860 RepID=UPI001FF5C21C|nr:hypothetical protein [Kocuria flava]MCJ8504806.1 hypothetical protein [Kocuria flava]